MKAQEKPVEADQKRNRRRNIKKKKVISQQWYPKDQDQSHSKGPLENEKSEDIV